MGGRGAVPVGIAVWLGVLLGASLGAAWAWGALALVPALAWLALRAPERTGAALALLAIALAAGARGAGHEALRARERTALGAAGAIRRLEGRVAEPPPREGGEPAAIVAVDRAAPALVRGTRLRLRLPAGADAEWGDRIVVVARLEPPRPPRAPGATDGRGVATAAALAGSGRAYLARSCPARDPGGWPRVTVARWRRALETRLDAGLSASARELVVPLVTGDRSGMPTALAADLRAAGLIHLLALSGLHVVWLASVARALVASLGGGVGPRAVAAALCALLYAGLAGPLPSLLRAAAHECLMAAATLRGRALDPVQALAVVAAGLLAVAPGWAADLGFQLSCAATLGLVVFGPPLTPRARRARAACGPFVPTLAAQAGALPLLLARFHAVSWVGTFANLVAVPVSGLLLAAAWLGALAELALPGAGHAWFSAAEVLAAALRATTGVAARAPRALLAAGPEGGIAWCAAAGALLLAVALPRPRALDAQRRAEPAWRPPARLLGAALLATALGCAATARPLAPPRGAIWLVALDVGQGAALALGSGGSWWLVDAGPRGPGYDAAEGVVLPFLRWAGVTRLEAVLVTHDDSDHAGGVPAVLRGVAVGRLGRASRAGARAPLPGAGPAPRPWPLARGDSVAVGPLLRVLWPPRQARGLRGNDASLVLEAGRARGRMLLMADVDSMVEESLAVAPGVAVLQAAHHGAASSSGARFLARVRPRLALLSVGARNRFGHPAPALLARLAAAHVAVARTDESGTLWIESRDDGARRLDWRRGEWRAPPRHVPLRPVLLPRAP
jgi:competence protein ComEC